MFSPTCKCSNLSQVSIEYNPVQILSLPNPRHLSLQLLLDLPHFPTNQTEFRTFSHIYYQLFWLKDD